jgi:metal-sulfur cluster biosynthetic enzyme
MVDKEQVLKKLKNVLDPELKVNIVDLGLIYDIEVRGKDVFILSTLTFPGCPLGSIIHQEIKEKVGSIKGIGEIKVKITFDPPWDLSKISEEAKLEIGMI